MFRPFRSSSGQYMYYKTQNKNKKCPSLEIQISKQGIFYFCFMFYVLHVLAWWWRKSSEHVALLNTLTTWLCPLFLRQPLIIWLSQRSTSFLSTNVCNKKFNFCFGSEETKDMSQHSPHFTLLGCLYDGVRKEFFFQQN